MIANPPRNALHAGLPIDGLKELVRLSGYPLQTVVASELQKQFVVTEEWGYPDRNTQEHRSLDVFGFRALPEENRSGRSIRASVALLVECKQSALPYFFFQSVAYQSRPVPLFPTIAGLSRLELSNSQGSREVGPAECLGLDSELSIFGDPPVCASFARAAKKGKGIEHDTETPSSPGPLKVKNLEITGADAYQNVIMPLASAIHHLREAYRPASEPNVNPTLALAVCVLDAPMILVAGPPESPSLNLTPWIRVVRQEKHKVRNWFQHSYEVVDFVHRDALGEFVTELLAFASLFRERAVHVLSLMRKGRGKVADLNNWTWNDISE